MGYFLSFQPMEKKHTLKIQGQKILDRCFFLPRKSDDEAQKILPIILDKDNRATNPAAIATIFSGSKIFTATSWNIGEATPRTPIPAETFKHSTIHNNQN